jgi:hypothetical protein
MAVAEMFALEFGAAGEVGCPLVPVPEPWGILLVSLWLVAAILVPIDLGTCSRDSSAFGFDVGYRDEHREYEMALSSQDINFVSASLATCLFP